MNARHWLAILLLAAVGVLAAAACGGDDSDGPAVQATGTGTTQAGAPVELTQSDSQGGVEIDVTWVTPETLGELDSEQARGYGLDGYVLLEIQFTTHSGDLSPLDMTALSAIRVAGQEYAPQAWESISDDSHHREGVLVFAREASDGVSLDAGTVELVMKDIADVPERLFRWQWPARSG
jgi:hypothetical protein